MLVRISNEQTKNLRWWIAGYVTFNDASSDMFVDPNQHFWWTRPLRGIGKTVRNNFKFSFLLTSNLREWQKVLLLTFIGQHPLIVKAALAQARRGAVAWSNRLWGLHCSLFKLVLAVIIRGEPFQPRLGARARLDLHFETLSSKFLFQLFELT